MNAGGLGSWHRDRRQGKPGPDTLFFGNLWASLADRLLKIGHRQEPQCERIPATVVPFAKPACEPQSGILLSQAVRGHRRPELFLQLIEGLVEGGASGLGLSSF
jgi:hypothetical protein